MKAGLEFSSAFLFLELNLLMPELLIVSFNSQIPLQQ